MSKLTFMQHGSNSSLTCFATKQGWCDSPLTDWGSEQAKLSADPARAWPCVRSHAYSSTSERACDTLELAFPDQPYERVKGLGSGTLASLRARARI